MDEITLHLDEDGNVVEPEEYNIELYFSDGASRDVFADFLQSGECESAYKRFLTRYN